MAKSSLLIIITTLLLAFVSCQNKSNDEGVKENKVCTLWVYNSQSTLSYQINLYDNILDVKIVDTYQDENNHPISIRSVIIENNNTKISDDNMKKIYVQLEKIYSNQNIKNNLNTDDFIWKLKLEYKDKIIIQNYLFEHFENQTISNMMTSPDVQNLCNTLFKNSPIEINTSDYTIRTN